MKKISLMTLAVLVSAPAFAADMQKATFGTKAGELYMSGQFGYMEKQSERDGKVSAGMTRNTLDVQYGITDITSVVGTVQYTSNPDAMQNGMTIGEIGFNHRILGANQPVILDVYYKAHLGGLMEMQAELANDPNNTATGMSLFPENYTSGRWGGILGFKLGKDYGKFAHQVWAEAKYLLSGDNAKIEADDLIVGIVPTTITANGYATPTLKSGTDFFAGYKASYQLTSKYTIAGGLTYRNIDANSVEKMDLSNIEITPSVLETAAKAGFEQKMIGSMQDGYQEWITNLGVYYAVSDNSQVGVYGEYTYDDAEYNQRSNKENKYKYELGVKFNYLF